MERIREIIVGRHLERTAAMYRLEAQRLASQIQEIARVKSEASSLPAVENLERKLGLWLTDWQKSMDSRDRELSDKIRAELAVLRESIESRFSELESRVPSNVEERFNRIASAARALAESAGSFSTQLPPKA